MPKKQFVSQWREPNPQDSESKTAVKDATLSAEQQGKQIQEKIAKPPRWQRSCLHDLLDLHKELASTFLARLGVQEVDAPISGLEAIKTDTGPGNRLVAEFVRTLENLEPKQKQMSDGWSTTCFKGN
jgi:hypothetical protein